MTVEPSKTVPRKYKKRVPKNRMATCHPDRPHYAKGLCMSCYRKQTEIRKPNYTRELRLAFYGLTIEEYNKILDEQGGVCAICGRPPTGRALDVDHEHQLKEKTRTPESRRQRIRGLLCHRCNRALGLLGNKPEVLLFATKNLSEYIEKYYAKRLYDKEGSEAITKMNNAVKYLSDYEQRKARY